MPTEFYGWSVKDTKKNKVRQIELRKSVSGAQILAIVSGQQGFTFGYHKPDRNSWGHTNQGYDLRLSMNGSALMQLEDLETLNKAVKAAIVYLEESNGS